MIIQCRKCGTKYRFDKTKITGKGIWVRCRNCETVFFQKNPSTEISTLMDLMTQEQETPREATEERSDTFATTEVQEDAGQEPSWDDAFHETDEDREIKEPEKEKSLHDETEGGSNEQELSWDDAFRKTDEDIKIKEPEKEKSLHDETEGGSDEQELSWDDAFRETDEDIKVEKGEEPEDILGEIETKSIEQGPSWEESYREADSLIGASDNVEEKDRIADNAGVVDITRDVIEEKEPWDTGERIEVDRGDIGDKNHTEDAGHDLLWEENHEEAPGERTEAGEFPERQRVREPWAFGDVDEELYDERTAEGAEKGRGWRIARKIVLALILLVLLLACVYLWAFPEEREALSKKVFAPIERLLEKQTPEPSTNAAVPAVSPGKPEQETQSPEQAALPELKVVLKDVAERFVKGWTDKTIMVVEGSAVNSNSVPVSNIRVQGKILDSAGSVIATEESSCGTILTDDELKGMTGDEIKKELTHPYGRDFRNAGIAPDESIPFMLVFTMPDEEASELVVELIGIEASKGD